MTTLSYSSEKKHCVLLLNFDWYVASHDLQRKKFNIIVTVQCNNSSSIVVSPKIRALLPKLGFAQTTLGRRTKFDLHVGLSAIVQNLRINLLIKHVVRSFGKER